MLIPGNGGKGNPRLRCPTLKCNPPACETVAAPSNTADSKSIFFIQ